MSIHNDIEKILISEEEIQEKIKEVGAMLTEEYKDKNPLVCYVHEGTCKFCAEFFVAEELYE